MDFFIGQNSDRAILLYPVDQIAFDLGYEHEIWENCAVTFSMFDIENDKYVIANKSGEIYARPRVIESTEMYSYYLKFIFNKFNTRRQGKFIGDFKVDFFGEQCGNLTLPLNGDKINIYINKSYTKTTLVNQE